jgi:hypothetical protein
MAAPLTSRGRAARIAWAMGLGWTGDGPGKGMGWATGPRAGQAGMMRVRMMGRLERHLKAHMLGMGGQGGASWLGRVTGDGLSMGSRVTGAQGR